MPIKYIDQGGESDLQPHGPGMLQKAGAFAYGAATGALGGLGDVEKFGAYEVPKMFGFGETSADKQKTFFPTTEDVQGFAGKIGIPKPSEDVRGYQTGGEIAGGFVEALPGMIRGGAKLLGKASKTGESLAQEAEKMGFKLSPAQVREASPLGARGATGFVSKNQELANRLVSRATGKEVPEVSEQFIATRLKELGKDFDKVYAGKKFNLDQQAMQQIQRVADIQAQLPNVAATPAIRDAANKIGTVYQNLVARGGRPGTLMVDGEELQRISSGLRSAARSTSDLAKRHEIMQLAGDIDASIARTNPQAAAELNRLRPLYANTAALEELAAQGGIKTGNVSLERLGKMLAQRPGGIRYAESTDFNKLGQLGRELNIRSLAEREGKDSTDAVSHILGKTLSTSAGALGLRSRAARAAQRAYAGKEIPAAARAGMVSAPGAVGETLKDQNDDQ